MMRVLKAMRQGSESVGETCRVFVMKYRVLSETVAECAVR